MPTTKCVPDSNHLSTPTAGWLVELAGDMLDAPLFLSISITKARFGWTPHRDQALMLARETDADAFAKYANARTREGTMAIVRRVDRDRDTTALERENDRLRRRIGDLESILTALRKIRATDIERAMGESQSTDE
jgi:predicted  nucleic acid-binding Zn-ribbon protein